MVTEATVRMRLLTMAVYMIPFCCREDLLDVLDQVPLGGQRELELADSLRSLAAVRTMKMKGMTKTTKTAASETTSSQYLRTSASGPHSSISLRAKNRIIG